MRREPSAPAVGESKPVSIITRDPSYPDRARIDSDVRAFLRPHSSPWMVFNRDTHDTQVDILPARSSILASAGVFPEPAPDAPVEVIAEPSNVVVAADLQPPPEPEPAAETQNVAVAPVEEPAPSWFGARARTGLLIAGAVVGIVGLASVTTFVLGSQGHAKASPTVAAMQPRVTAPAEAPPPDIALPGTDGTAASASSAAPGDPAAPDMGSTDPKKKFGRLTIKGEARHRNVYMDGKRMLGHGPRSFTVFCGSHKIAVNEKADEHTLEIPCNGELVVSK